jgi:hypothetical protein
MGTTGFLCYQMQAYRRLPMRAAPPGWRFGARGVVTIAAGTVTPGGDERTLP